MQNEINPSNVLAIVPARYASSRLPGKPLARIAGYPMVQWVYQRVRTLFPNTLVATDDTRILEAVERFGGSCILTSPTLNSGTERCAEALKNLKRADTKLQVVINIQGDEPFIDVEPLKELIAAFSDPNVSLATFASHFSADEDPQNPNRPKIVRDTQGNALYFSRATIPYHRDGGTIPSNAYLKHIGVYAYRPDTLLSVATLPPSPLEQAEKLEQLRWLENGFSIRVVTIENSESIAVDTPEDLARANEYAMEHGLHP